jgi:hypothetical protein
MEPKMLSGGQCKGQEKKNKAESQVFKTAKEMTGYEKGRCPLHLRSKAPNIVIKTLVKVQVNRGIHI